MATSNNQLKHLSQALQQLQSVHDVRQFMATELSYPVRIELPGQALDGYSEYKALLQQQFDAMRSVMDQKIKLIINEQEKRANAIIKQIGETL